MKQPLIRFDEMLLMPYLHALVKSQHRVPGVITDWSQVDVINTPESMPVANPLFGYKFSRVVSVSNFTEVVVIAEAMFHRFVADASPYYEIQEKTFRQRLEI